MLTLNLSVDRVFDLCHRLACVELGLKTYAAYTLGHFDGSGCKSSHSIICREVCTIDLDTCYHSHARPKGYRLKMM